MVLVLLLLLILAPLLVMADRRLNVLNLRLGQLVAEGMCVADLVGAVAEHLPSLVAELTVVADTSVADVAPSLSTH
jgi:hypothetical protein